MQNLKIYFNHESYLPAGFFVYASNNNIVIKQNGKKIRRVSKKNTVKNLTAFLKFLTKNEVTVSENVIEFLSKFFANFLEKCNKKLLKNNILPEKLVQKRFMCSHSYKNLELFLNNLGLKAFPFLYNYFTENFDQSLLNQDAKNLIGPDVFFEYRINTGLPNQKNIAFFGERHFPLESFQYEILVPSIEDKMLLSSFIKNLVTRNPEIQFDLYLEFPYVKSRNDKFLKTSLWQRSLDDHSICLNMFAIEFFSCFDYEKHCKYKNVRGHYVDFRKALDFSARSDFFVRQIENALFQNPLEILEIQKDLMHFVESLSQNNKLLQTGVVRDFINVEFNSYLKPLLFFKPTKLLQSGVPAIKKKLLLFLENLGVLFMDYYVLSRLLKEKGSYQKNIIIGTGSFHTQRYQRFFDNYPNAELTNHYVGKKGKLSVLEANSSKRGRRIFNISEVNIPAIDLLSLDKEKSFLFNSKLLLN